MKAIVFNRANEICQAERIKPEPQPGEVLLRIRRIGYCGSDLNAFRGLNPVMTYPCIPGHEIGATIESVTPEAPEKFKPGMAVTVLPYTSCGKCSACLAGRVNACRSNQTLGVQRDGALTEFICVAWQKLLHSPKLSQTELALVEPLSVGFHAVERGRVVAADTVCVLGSGMIGLGAIAGAALLRQARVIAVDVDDAKLQLARRAGAAAVINSRTESLHQRLQELTQGHGPAVIIEAVGAEETFLAAIDEVGFAGRVVYVGYAKKPLAYETKFFLLKELDILGSRNATWRNFEEVVAVLESGAYPVRETITRTVPFSDAAQAMRDWSSNPAQVTKIHIEI
jgi:2-desacetyl-2-hydroxyethyl bacteriochlorophyllide A dehydrogenase